MLAFCHTMGTFTQVGVQFLVSIFKHKFPLKLFTPFTEHIGDAFSFDSILQSNHSLSSQGFKLKTFQLHSSVVLPDFTFCTTNFQLCFLYCLIILMYLSQSAQSFIFLVCFLVICQNTKELISYLLVFSQQ